MTKQTKIIIGIVAGILVLCMITCVAGILLFRTAGSRLVETVDQEPVEVESTAGEIVDFEVPPGFEPQSSMDLFGVKMAMYTNNSNDHFMVMMQMPTNADDNIVEQMRTAVERNTGRNFVNMRTIEQRELTVRGQPASLVIQEGTDQENNRAFRQFLLAFEGQNGTAMIAVFGPVETWDQDVYERMIESIR